VIIRDGRLIFKADVQADTPEVVYLEGVYIAPEERGSGLARRCLSQLCEEILVKTRSICVLVNEQNERAQAFYRLCGFRRVSSYDSVFLHREEQSMADGTDVN
jgi:predicted GNAT family acetyltransferase